MTDVIVIDKLTKSFKGKTVLEDVNMQLQEGGIYGIVGVATNEKTGDGIDEKKRARLMSAGADMIIPHFEGTDAILKALHI